MLRILFCKWMKPGERVTAKDDGHDDDYCKEKGGKGKKIGGTGKEKVGEGCGIK